MSIESVCCVQVLVVTSLGEFDIELWSKEAPLACRNFVQLCMEGYYDNTVFHRVIRSVCVCVSVLCVCVCACARARVSVCVCVCVSVRVCGV